MHNRLIKLILLTIIFVLASGFFNLESGKAQTEAVEPGVFRSDKLEMIVRGGFGKVSVNGWQGTWTPFRVTLANQGEQIVGQIRIKSQSSINQNQQGREFIKTIQLPTGSRQYHEIPVFLYSGDNIDVTLEASGKVVAQTTLEAERQSGIDDELNIAVVDTDTTTLNNITSMMLTNRAGNNNQTPRNPFEKVTAENTIQIRKEDTPQTASNPQPNRRRNPRFFGNGDVTAHPQVISAEDMPRDFISYQPVEVVVLGDAPLNQLTEDQAQALKNWVASGGMLIVTGGTDVAGLHAAKLDDLLPVSVESSATIAALPELTDLYGVFDNPAPLVVLSAKAKPDAKVILGTNDKTLVAENRYGNGLVRFVAINPKLNPYRSWNNGRYLWSDLLNPAIDQRGFFSRRGGSSDFLYSLANIKPASSSYFLIFLLAYVLAVGPINYLVLRKMKKLDSAWITIPAVAILFTMVSVGVGQFRKVEGIAADAVLVEFFQKESIQNIRGGFLLRGEGKGTQIVNLDGKTSFAVDDNRNGPPPVGKNIEIEREAAKLNLTVPTTNGTPGYFSLRSVINEPSMMIRTTENGTSVKIKNLSDKEISEAVYVCKSGITDLFTIAAGEEKEVALNNPQSIPFPDWYAAQLPPANPDDPSQNNYESQMFDGLVNSIIRGTGKNKTRLQAFWENELMTNAYKNLEHSMLIGFTNHNPAPVHFNNATNRKSRALYVIYL
ncbi:MAG: hypothetical protein AB1757_22745 [Acidobacteriota bacterium]